jgi:hypothetical protein
VHIKDLPYGSSVRVCMMFSHYLDDMQLQVIANNCRNNVDPSDQLRIFDVSVLSSLKCGLKCQELSFRFGARDGI